MPFGIFCAFLPHLLSGMDGNWFTPEGWFWRSLLVLKHDEHLMQ